MMIMKRIMLNTFALAVCLFCSCNKADNVNTVSTGEIPVIAEYPSYEDTKAVGTAEVGKTSWAAGDTIYLSVSKTSAIADQTMFKMVHDGSKWNMIPSEQWGTFSTGDVYFTAIYAPGYAYQNVEGSWKLALKPGNQDGLDEFFKSSGKWNSTSRSISFKRGYSRIRVATTAGYGAVLSCSNFIPVGLDPKVLGDKELKAVANASGNAFFYGKMESSSRIVITLYNGATAVANCYLDGKTLESGKSYAVSPESKSKTIKILAIGNSFSADAVEQELYGLFESIKQPVIIGDAYIGGCPLVTHADNAKNNSASYSYRKTTNGEWTKTASQTLQSILQNEKWDYVSLQEGAGFHGFYNQTYQGTTHSMEPDLTYMINYVKTYCPDAKLIYHACWTAKKGYTGVKFSYYGYDQSVMYNMIVNASKEVLAAHNEFDIYINTVDAIQNLKTSYLGDNVQRDGWHLDYTAGRYTASCIWFEKIMGRTVMGNSYKCSAISDAKALLCQTAAHQACLNPGKITDLSYIPKEPEDTTIDKKVLAKWIFTPDRAVSDGYIKPWCNQTKPGVYSYGNQPGETGYILANDGGSGKLSFVQIDKTAWTAADELAGRSIFDVSNGGQPVQCGTMAGDYWLFETTGGYDIPEGSKIRCVFTITPSKYGQKYWMLEYKDGTEWKPAYTVKTVDISTSGEKGVKYNMALTKEKVEHFEFTAVLENPMTDFAFRIVCSSEYQVNDKWFNHPRTASTYRIAGDPANPEKPCPEIDLMLN